MAAASNALERVKGRAAVLVAVATIGAVLPSDGRLTVLIESVAVGDVRSIVASVLSGTTIGAFLSSAGKESALVESVAV